MWFDTEKKWHDRKVARKLSKIIEGIILQVLPAKATEDVCYQILIESQIRFSLVAFVKQVKLFLFYGV